MKVSIKACIVILFIFSVNTIAEDQNCSHCICISQSTSNDCTECCKKIKLFISDDGKIVVDQYNNEIAKISSNIKFKAQQDKNGLQKIPGCMCPSEECIIYDQNGRCVQSHTTFTWDFDCNCKK